MFCKHCGHKLTQGETVCPGCGTQIDPTAFGVQNFKVQLPSHEKELQALLEHADAKRQAVPAQESEDPDLPTEFIDISSGAEIDDSAPSPAELSPQTAAPAVPAQPESAAAPQTPFLDIPPVASPAAAVPPPAPIVPQPESRTARRSRHVFTAVVCLFAVALVGLLAVRLTTTLFDSSNSGLEPVSLNTLTDAEKEEILACLSAYSPLFDEDTFIPQEMGVGAFFAALDLNKTNNLYSAVSGQLQRVTDTADPLGRFADGEGAFSYYRIAESDLNAVAARYGVSLPGSGNNSSYYYYDGAYYFAANTAPTGARAPTLRIAKAQNTEDGSCYIVLADERDTAVAYALVGRDASSADAAEAPDDAENGAWTLLELSNEPLFREDGTRMVAETTPPAYEMRHEVISATAADGTVYAEYVLDYPYFTDTANEPAATVNALYAQMLASYKELAQNAEQNYQKYLKRGYDTRLLPGYTYMVSTVTYNENGTVSLLDELTEYLPDAAAKALKAQQAENTRTAETSEETISATDFIVPTITYSGTTIDTASGAFLRRDDIFSGDFERYQTLLYHIFAGADEATLADLASRTATEPATEEATTEAAFGAVSTTEAAAEPASALPTLSDAEAAIGQQIYASPWVLTKSGVRFCYLGNGYYTYVTLPFDYVELKTES